MSKSAPPRTASVERSTKETEIRLELDARRHGRGRASRPASASSTTCSTLLARHGALDLDGEREGRPRDRRAPHVEDVGIVLGQALDEALGDRAGIRRYGHAVVPMDEALGACAIDISGRPLLLVRGRPPGDLDRRVRDRAHRGVLPRGREQREAHAARPRARGGTNAHHMVEACFKAFARALREAVALTIRETGVPSTKGVL